MNGKMSPFNKVYNSLRTNEAWRFTDDLTSYTQWGLDLTKSSGQVVPLIFNNTYQNYYLNLQQVPGNVGAYPFIRYIDITNQKSAIYRQIYGKFQSSNNSVTFPANSTGNVQTSNVSTLDQARQLLINTVPSGVTITDIAIAPFGSGSFRDLFNQNITSGGTVLDLESYFGSEWGANSNPGFGFTIRFTANNTNGSPSSVNYTLFGTTRNAQNNTWLVDYQDAHNQLHRLGTFDDGVISKTFYLDRLIPVPITDPTTPNFGTLLFTLLRSDQSFYTTETYDIVTSLSIVYLLPETY